MCHFLTISVPSEVVPTVPKKYRRNIHFSEQKNESIASFTRPEWTSFVMTSGGCSCDLYCDDDGPNDDGQRLVDQYKKKGRSDAKIRRVLEGRKLSVARSKGLRDDALDAISDLVVEFGEIRVSLHWYSGEIGSEVFHLENKGSVSLTDFRKDSTILGGETTLAIKNIL